MRIAGHSLTTDASLRIDCRRAPAAQVGTQLQQGLLVSDADVRLLRLLTKRALVVVLRCPGLPLYQADIAPLLSSLRLVAGQGVWFVSTSLSGPLRQVAPASEPRV